MTDQMTLFDVDTPPVVVPKRKTASDAKPRWSAYNPKNPVRCDDCMLVLAEAKGEGHAARNARMKRTQGGEHLLLCYAHGRARRIEDGVE